MMSIKMVKLPHVLIPFSCCGSLVRLCFIGTIQSISILVYMLEYQHNTGPHLVIVPKSTLSNWMNEIKRWAPTLTAVKFHGDKATREEIINDILCPGQKDSERTWNVCITTYEVVNIEKNVLNKFVWSYLIIDEAHR